MIGATARRRRRTAPPAAPLLLAAALASAACGPRVGVPAVAGLEAEEPALAAYLAELLAAAQALPESAPMRGRLAMAYHANGFGDAAIASYAQAQALAPQAFRWPYLRALLLAESGQHEAALASLDQALALNAEHAPAWLHRGGWLLDAGRVDEAAAAYAEAAARATEPQAGAAATVGTARALLRQGDAEAAAALLEPLTASQPYAATVLARAHRALGRPVEAAAAAPAGAATGMAWPDEHLEAVATHVRGFSGLLSQAETHLAAGRPRAALAILEPLREAHPNDRVLLNNLAVAYARANRPDAVQATLQRALEQYPGNHLFHFNLAAAYRDQGDAAAALRHLDACLGLRPAFVPAHEEKVALLIDAGRYDEATAAVAAAELQGRQRPPMLFYGGVLDGAAGRWPSAIERFEALLRLEPSFPKGRLYLGRALAEAGRLEDAHAALIGADGAGATAADLADARARLAVLAGCVESSAVRSEEDCARFRAGVAGG